MPTFEIENKCGARVVAGIDEVGLGALAGPLVVCACVIRARKLSGCLMSSIDDSKRLSHRKREMIFEHIINDKNFVFGISIVDSTLIDEMGLSGAWKYGILQSISNLEVLPDIYLLDGNKKIEINQGPVESIVKGDQKSFSIASASIIAKVTRDRIMQKIHAEFPMYGFDTNVGYGTRAHMQAIKTYGITSYHRKSYSPISKHTSPQ